MRRLSVRISNKLIEALKDISKKENVSVSFLVRESLKKFLAVKMVRYLRSQTLPFAKTSGFFSDEDIFIKI